MNVKEMEKIKLGPADRAFVNSILDDVAENPEAAAWTIAALRAALQALYAAMPAGYGNDRGLEEALRQAEEVLGVKRV